MNSIGDILKRIRACEPSRDWVDEWLHDWRQSEHYSDEFPEPLWVTARRIWYACPYAGFLLYIVKVSQRGPFGSVEEHCRWLERNREAFDERLLFKKELTANDVRAKFPFERIASRLGCPPNPNLPLPGLEDFA